MTYYRDNSYAQNSHTPLIDLIPDHGDLHDVSDEEDSFYGKEDEFLIPAKLQNRINQLPRRLKRDLIVFCALALAFLIGWWTFIGPKYSKHREELLLMDNAPAMSYGSNVRPAFKDMIQVKDMDQSHLPKKGKRLVFIGDVHGCKEELEHLLKKVQFTHTHDHLVLVGDMITKGPDSPGVVKLIRNMGASCVRGNWEDKLLLIVAAARKHHKLSAPTTDEDDDQPLDLADEKSHPHIDKKLLRLAKKFSKKDLEYLQQCPVILRVGSVPHLGNLVSVHAGLVPDTPLEEQDPVHVMNMRTIDLSTRIPSSKHGGTPWEKFWNHQQAKLKKHERTTVIYGHNRKRGLNIQDYTKGLDTGCASGGHLTALVIDSEGSTELVSVKCKRAEGYDED